MYIYGEVEERKKKKKNRKRNKNCRVIYAWAMCVWEFCEIIERKHIFFLTKFA